VNEPDSFWQEIVIIILLCSAGSRPLDGWGGDSGLPKNFFWPFGPQFGLKIRGEGGGGPSPGSVTATDFKQEGGSGGHKL